MTRIHQPTREEEAFHRFCDEKWETLSEGARDMLVEVGIAAHNKYMVHNYCYQPEEYDEAHEKMLVAATNLAVSDRELLEEFVRLAITAAASVDLFDQDTLTGYRTYGYSLHWNYRTMSDMVWGVLLEQDEREWLARQEPVDVSDFPF